jgi:hypothetical protein
MRHCLDLRIGDNGNEFYKRRRMNQGLASNDGRVRGVIFMEWDVCGFSTPCERTRKDET